MENLSSTAGPVDNGIFSSKCLAKYSHDEKTSIPYIVYLNVQLYLFNGVRVQYVHRCCVIRTMKKNTRKYVCRLQIISPKMIELAAESFLKEEVTHV